jgi:hypothetical protein
MQQSVGVRIYRKRMLNFCSFLVSEECVSAKLQSCQNFNLVHLTDLLRICTGRTNLFKFIDIFHEVGKHYLIISYQFKE